MDLAPSQHDRFFRALMERPNTAGALLRERLPRAIADELVGDPVLVEGSFLDEQMRSSYSDRLYRVELRSGSLAFVYCLVEHKSSPEPRIALQLLRYQVRIWERFDRDFGGKGLLPPIYPLVVYHGRSEWTVSLRFAGLLSASDEQKLHLLDFPFGLLDVGQVDDRELSRQRELKAGLMVLKYSGRVTEHDVEEVVRRVLSELRGASDELIRLAVRYMINAYRPLSWTTLESAMKQSLSEKEQEMLSKAAEELLARGEERGIIIGEERGEAKALVLVLERRFGRLPEELLKRIGDAKPPQLESWLGLAVSATALGAVFGEPIQH